MMVGQNEVEKMSPNKLVSWFMISSYAYYRLSKPVMEDSTFDYLVQRLKGCYDEADHYHKKYITEDNLNAATGFDIHYPNIVKFATASYLKENNLWNS
jgi:hypothetical protein